MQVVAELMMSEDYVCFARMVIDTASVGYMCLLMMADFHEASMGKLIRLLQG